MAPWGAATAEYTSVLALTHRSKKEEVMAGFSLTKGTDTFDFALDGTVTKAGAPAGSWNTNQNNQILVKAADGAQNPIDVVWKFNPDNQLCLFSGTNQAYNFHQDGANPPFYQLGSGAVLQAFPD